MRVLTARRESIAALSVVVLFALLAVLIGVAWFNNLPSLLRDVSWLGIVAIGQAVVIISGEFDLSVGSVYAFVSLIFVMLLNADIGPLPALLLALLLAALIGYVNGILTWRLRLPSLLVTLGFLFIYRGLVEYVTGGYALVIPDEIRGSFWLQLLGGKSFGTSPCRAYLRDHSCGIHLRDGQDAFRQSHLRRRRRCNCRLGDRRAGWAGSRSARS